MHGIPWTEQHEGIPIGIPAMTSNTSASFSIPNYAYIFGGTAAVLGGWPVVLGAAGWTAGGIAAGSLAAGVQAAIGNVAAGSMFAVAQSAAMGGSATGLINGVVVGTGAVVAALNYGESKKCKDCKDKEKREDEDKTGNEKE